MGSSAVIEAVHDEIAPAPSVPPMAMGKAWGRCRSQWSTLRLAMRQSTQLSVPTRLLVLQFPQGNATANASGNIARVSLQGREGSTCHFAAPWSRMPQTASQRHSSTRMVDDQRNVLPETATLCLRACAGDLPTQRRRCCRSQHVVRDRLRLFSTLAHRRLLPARGRAFEMSRTGRSSPRTSSGRRAWGVRS